PYDPVARFHLGNGAIVHDVHADADTSPRGQAQSAGVMVNYLYDLDKVEQNHEEFMNTKNVHSSQVIKDLANAFSIPEDKGLEIVATSSSG
ncbi:MAG: malonyl-CoA decarboxylase family protein, partial [Lentilitoribacter sp.]